MPRHAGLSWAEEAALCSLMTRPIPLAFDPKGVGYKATKLSSAKETSIGSILTPDIQPSDEFPAFGVIYSAETPYHST